VPPVPPVPPVSKTREYKTLKDLLTDIRANPDIRVIELDRDDRSRLLGEFLQQPQDVAFMQGSYYMPSGEWRIRSGHRSMTLVKTKFRRGPSAR
jgi:hypothetical protein